MNAFSMVLVQSVGRLHLVHFLTHVHHNTGTNRTRWGAMKFQRQAQLIAVFTTAGRESRVFDCSLDSGLFSCQSTSIYKNWQHSGDTCFDESETSFFAPIKTKFCGFHKKHQTQRYVHTSSSWNSVTGRWGTRSADILSSARKKSCLSANELCPDRFPSASPHG